MSLKTNIKNTVFIFGLLKAVTVLASVKSPHVDCAIFANSCSAKPIANNLYHQFNPLQAELSNLPPQMIVDSDVPIMLTATTIPLLNSMSNMTLLNNGLYLGAQATYSTRLNATDYLFMQNPVLHTAGEDVHVMNVPVNLVNNDDPGGRFYVGYHFNDYFALEERYTRFALGNIHQMTGEEYDNYVHIPKNNDYEFIARQSVPFTSRMSLLTKEGKALISSNMAAAMDHSDPFSNNDSENDHRLLRTVLGVGAGISVSQRLTADMYYTYLLNTPQIHAQLISAGMTYNAR